MSRTKPLHWLGGFIADLPTPFDDRDRIGWSAFEMLCEHQIGSGATAMVVNETMGEASTLSEQEQRQIIHGAVKNNSFMDANCGDLDGAQTKVRVTDSW